MKSKLLSNVRQNKQLYSIIALILVCSTGAFAFHNQDSETNLIQIPLESNQMKINEVDAIVNNMINGDVTASEAHDYIFNERFFAKKHGETLTGDKLESNKRYISYLNEADKVVISFKYGQKVDLTKMIEAKSLI